MNKDFEVVILSACRTPIGSFGGALKELWPADLGALVVREAIARAGVSHEDIGDVVLGCVLQAGAGMNVARQAALKAGLPNEVPGEVVNRVEFEKDLVEQFRWQTAEVERLLCHSAHPDAGSC